MSIAIAGYASSAVVHALLALWMLSARARLKFPAATLLALLVSVVWCWLEAASGPPVPADVSVIDPVLRGTVGISDLLRIGCWTLIPVLLLRAVGPGADVASSPPAKRFPRALALALVVSSCVALWILATFPPLPENLRAVLLVHALPLGYVALTLYALATLEGLFSRADPGRRRALTLLCVALGTLFGFEFFTFTDALLFRRLDPDLWSARGYVSLFVAVPIAVALAGAPERAMRLRVSHGAATGSVLLLLAGCYLLLVAGAGYLLRLTGVPGIEPLPIVLGVLALAALLALLASRRLRGTVRVFLAKHLFRYKYDYRTEWLRFTSALSRDARATPASIVEALTAIVDSESGALWARREREPFALLAQRGVTGYDALDPAELEGLERFVRGSRWLVDLDEYRRYPERYADLTLPGAFVNSATAWLLVPLPGQDGPIGLVLIGRSGLMKRIDWEDRDLLKTAGHQAAGQLALYLTDAALSEARQFEAFNKASTYVMHDLKNILGQQSLIVANADRHRHKPAFVDDMVATIENSVQRMESLLRQLDKRDGTAERRPVPLQPLLESVVRNARGRRPEPRLSIDPEAARATVLADAERLERIVGHLVQNAQEASDSSGRVEVRLSSRGARVLISVDDDGCGMTRDFIRDELFQPFRSTKGLTGMGVGAFEAREHATLLGGKLDVSSTPGQGSSFRLELALVSTKEAG